jgi:hypothetical protein
MQIIYPSFPGNDLENGNFALGNPSEWLGTTPLTANAYASAPREV